MDEKHYIAKVGKLWVSRCWDNIGSCNLQDDKSLAQKLNEKEAAWLRDNLNAELFEVTVTVKEAIVDNFDD